MTKFCCGGHVSNADNSFMPPSIYIMFEENVELPSIPKGFVYLNYYNQIQATCLFFGNILDEQRWLDRKRENLKEWITSL